MACVGYGRLMIGPTSYVTEQREESGRQSPSNALLGVQTTAAAIRYQRSELLP